MKRAITGRVLAAAVAVAAAGSSLIAFTPTAEAATACPTAKASMIRSAPGSGKTVALTFDDGAGGVTPQVLAILRKYNVRATFFNTGAHDAKYPAQVTQTAREGHMVANHTWEHRYPSASNGRWSRSYLNAQFDRTNAQQLKLTGKHSCFFRPPGGYVTSGMVAEAAKNRMSTVMWSVDTNDWKQSSRTTKASTNAIISGARQGYSQTHPIILMHVAKASHEPESQVTSNRSNDVAALPSIISGYLNRGYRFVDMAGKSGLNPRTTTTSVSTGTANVPVNQSMTAVTATVRDVRGAVAGKPVRWHSRPAGTSMWTHRGTVTTDSNGVARGTDRPQVPTEYTMSFPATSGYQASSTTNYRRLNTYTPASLPAPVVIPPGSGSGEPTPSPAPTPHKTSTASCVDGGRVTWKAKVVWGGSYLDAGGVRYASLPYVGWTTSRAGLTSTDNMVQTFASNGKMLSTYARTALVDYQAGAFSDARNPADPVSPTGGTEVKVRLGIDGDGKSDCSITLVEPVI